MNRNTRKRKSLIRKFGKKGQDAYPDPFSLKIFPTARNRNGTISVNKKRNMAMRVYINLGENKQSTTMTVHEPFLKHEPVIPKNHGYVEYRPFP